MQVRHPTLSGSMQCPQLLGDGRNASVKFMWQCLRVNATLVCWFLLDAALYDPPPPRQKGKRGRLSKKRKEAEKFKGNG